MEKINELRKRIDEIDAKLVALFTERLAVCGEIGEEKKKLSLPVEDAEREEAVVENVKKYTDERSYPYVKSLYKRIFTLAKGYQTENNKRG